MMNEISIVEKQRYSKTKPVFSEHTEKNVGKTLAVAQNFVYQREPCGQTG